MNPKVVKKALLLTSTMSKNSWTSYEQLFDTIIVDRVLLPVTLDEIRALIRAKNVDGLLAAADCLSVQKYTDATHHFVANQIAALIKKYPFPIKWGSTTPRETAKEKFLVSEQKCAETNKSFDAFLVAQNKPWAHPRAVSSASLLAAERSLYLMREFICRVLGDFPTLTSWYEACDFGPGASIGVTGDASNLKRKIASRWTVSPSASAYGFAAFSHDWNLLSAIDGNKGRPISMDGPLLREKFTMQCEYVDYNKISFVYKNAKTNRVVAIEPLINGYLQKGLDQIMRKKLRRNGLDLSDQSKNQRMAREGSLDDSDMGFVTIDLASASDSISQRLCEFMLPLEWYYHLDSIRSKYYKLDGVVSRYHKFCSMGNGFCFPLETLLFAAAAKAVGAGTAGTDFSVYGDDIIVRKKYAKDLLELLEILGFTVNSEKTFITGPFRESCGADWYLGKDVRPFTLDFALDSVVSVFKCLNLSRRNHNTTWFFSETRDFLLGLLPPVLHLFRPFPGPADSGIDCELDQFLSSPHAQWNKNLQAWEWLELLQRAVPDLGAARHFSKSLMIAALRGSRSDAPFTYRRRTRTYVVKKPRLTVRT